MKTDLINLSDYSSNTSLRSKPSYNYSSRKAISNCSLFEVEDNTSLVNNTYKISVTHESLVNFIIDYGIKVENNESEQYKRFMLSHHICIEFYGVKYYIPFYDFNEKETKVFDHLMKYNQTF